MEALLNLIKDTTYSESRPTKLLLLGNEIDGHLLQTPVDCGTHTITFVKVKDGVYYTKAGTNNQIVCHYLEKRLGHKNFILSELCCTQFMG
jgi:hypothetical protein